MDFTERMKDAMMAIHEACALNDEWSQCKNCPFDEYCDAIQAYGLKTPDDIDFIDWV